MRLGADAIWLLKSNTYGLISNAILNGNSLEKRMIGESYDLTKQEKKKAKN